ncbi:MAG: ABC transporter substrate-binding protein [Bacteroidales bacterium]|jgi:iron complex transport system substrate-binding protein|nr:ABC transporter substrate-binding protein [Bacteroidales bacterium]MDD2617194.1 ABC transporter substrate-binding protein [Bacteroidales bacterium]MDD4640356.1 ABC transporter substrate-binding protein [Bacteroidales bacterium]NLB01831.1 ABC transporter substrate-binding protein [Bacteroidales bacterium]
MSLHYARGFEIGYFDGYTRVLVYNPWAENEIMARYYLYREDSSLLPKDGYHVRIPLSSLAIASCTHVAFLDLLDELDLLRGVCNASMVYNPVLRQSINEGQVADLGDAFRIKREILLQIRPQALMASGYNQYDEHLQAISQAGVSILYNNEWMEQNLLARAEWLRFVACFLDKDRLADSLFRQTEANYLRLKELASSAAGSAPVVMSGDNFRGSWYMPGGRSHQAQLFRDAGASYFFENDSTTGSIALGFEQVVRDFNQADIWIGASNATDLNALLAMDERYVWFKSVKNKQVYSYQGRMTADGANDYWESAVVRPDSLLADFIKLFHPELLPGHEWIYINQLP